ncbi:cation transport protein-domain-containing protein [Aspergillus cavernicola]|uniref:Potassium transport protein n=1 Tax=Aspergillus cavernicola TaxID=176166 RepID=A0ABR4I4A3_9EURO
MFSALLRRVAHTKARIPWLKDLHMNFILIHYIYIISISMITSIIIYPGSHLDYIDALFFAVGAATQSGLNTVDFNQLYTYQQVVLYFVSMLTTPIFIHTALVFIRLYWFEKRFQNVVREARSFRTTRSRLRTISEDKDSRSYSREEAGINGRPIEILRNDAENPSQGDGPSYSPKSPEGSDSESVSPTSNASSAHKLEETQSPMNTTVNRDFGNLRVPAQLSPEHHIAFLENQRKSRGALRIPSPREYDRGGVPQDLEEENEENKLARTGSAQSEPRSPRTVDQASTPNMDGPHITINEPEMPFTRTRNSTFPRLDTRPTVHETNDENDENNENDPSPLARLNTRRPTFAGIVRSLTHERGRPTLPYLSWDATVGRNSNFIDLTEEQRDELGGIEYRALKTLAVVLISYYVCFHALGVICLSPWIMETHWGKVVTEAGQGRPWWAIFTAASAFNDVGFSITPDSMLSFQAAIFPLLLLTFLIVIGNTGFPCMLRLIIWALSKVASKETPLWEELKFLLDHPRRCFTLLFPRNATWWLFAILVGLNVIDLIFFIILDLNDPTVTSLSTGIKIVDGLFQASCTRTAGFSVVNIADLHPAVQVSYMIMMYISVFPIAISLRRTNVYEEKSLGVFETDDEVDDENQTAPSYIGTHLRKQLGFDLWYVCLGLFIITIVEGDHLENPNQYSFQIWSVLFEVVSAYGTVGLSLGYPGVNASFVSQFRVISTLVIIAMQIRGRHRGLPYSLDRAILLPSESLNQKEIVDAEKRMRRRTSNLSQIGSLGRQQSNAISENGASSALDPTERNTGLNTMDPVIRRQSTLRSQRSQR